MNQLSVKLFFIILLTTVTIQPIIAGEWGAGVAVATQQPPQIGVQHENLGAPFITYRGERLKVDFGAISYIMNDSDAFQIAIHGEFRFDGYEPKDSNALIGMTKRDPSFDAGVSLLHQANWGLVEIVLLNDITGTHDGFEAKTSYKYPIMSGQWLFVPSFGVSWQNESLVDYYYGIRADEVNTNRSVYSGYNARNLFAELAVGYAFSDKVELLAGFKYIQFDKSITDSPIISRDYQATAFTAFVYKF